MKITARFHPMPLLLGSVLLCSACAMQSERRTGDYGPSAYTSDAGIAERVNLALRSAPGVDLRHVKVDTFGGVVQVSGQVSSHRQAVATIAALNRVDGVKTVRSYLVESLPRPVVGNATAVAQAPTAAPALVVASSNSNRASTK